MTVTSTLGSLVPPVLTTLTACVVGVAVLTVHGESTTWLALLVLAGMTAVAVAWSEEITHALVYGLVLTAPIAITKSILAKGGVYSPGLELSVVDVFLGPLFLVWLVGVVVHRHRVHMPPPGVGVVLAIFGWAWVSGLLAEDRLAGVLAAMNQTKFLVEFVLLYNVVSTPRVLRRTLVAAAIGLAVNLLMVVAQLATSSPLAVQGAKASLDGLEVAYAVGEGTRAFRPSGFLLHPNTFADYLVIVLPVPIVLFMQRWQLHSAWRWGCAALAAAGTVALLATLSRGGWISFGVATLFAFIVGVRRGLIPLGRVLALGAVACGGLVAAVLLYPAIVYRVTESDHRSTETRLLMIDQASMIIRDNPLLGVGLANYTRASHRYTPASFATVPASYTARIRTGMVHNGYLLLWAERGIVGLLLHISVFVTCLHRFMTIRRWHDPLLQTVALGMLAGVVGQGTFYLFDHFYLDLRPGVFWLALGLIAAVLRIHQRGVDVRHAPSEASA